MELMKVKKMIEEKIESVSQQGINNTSNLEVLGELFDVYKDIGEIEEKEQSKKYGNYGEYSEGGYGAYSGYGARGNYREGYSEGNYQEGGYGEGNYGRRGVKGTGRGRRRYRGDDMIDEMSDHYGAYSEGREQYREGNYGAEQKSMKALEYMLESVVEFVKMLEKEASSQQEVQLIKKYTKKLAEM
jgi:hypothetical protein